ncbi:MAG: hypothetical protein R3C49_06950 [Planctomycetaceae bacterium]
MRLTLRTLLAYLDDRLPPANARELGQKIANSPFATDLAERIRDVVRRRRLASDTQNAKTIDPNLIAEYLDDQLTPELVALMEKEVLASDSSLAEVAAVHQILGLLTDPVEISDTLKQRLYRMAPSTETPQESAADDAAPPEPQNGQAAEWKPLAPQTTAQRTSPMLVLLLMAVGWLALLFTDAHLFQPAANPPAPEPPDNREAVTAKTDEGNADPAVAMADNQKGPKPVVEPVAGTENVPPVAVAETTLPKSATPDTASEPEKTMVAAAATPEPKAPAGSEPSAASLPMKPDTGGSPETAPVTKPAAETTPATVSILEIRDAHQMLVTRDVENDSWIWTPSADFPPTHNWSSELAKTVAAVAEPFQVSILAPQAEWSALVVGSSLFRGLSGNEQGLELIDGQLLLQRTSDTSTSLFHLRAGGTVLKLTLPQLQGRTGILVAPVPGGLSTGTVDPAADGILPLNQTCVVHLYCADTECTVAGTADGDAVTIPAGSVWTWTSGTPVMAGTTVTAVTAVPDWVFQVTNVPSQAVQERMATTARQLREESSVTSGAIAATGNSHPDIATAGVQLLTILHDAEQLTTFLLHSEEAVVRQEAIKGLRKIVNESSAGYDEVLRRMENRLAGLELENTMKLLTGISKTAAEDRETSAWLVDLLDSGRLSIRELAINNLENLLGDADGYFADDDNSSRRTNAVRRWKRHLERNDGRLVKPTE